MTAENASPSRQGLIVGAALVAIHGLKAELTFTARTFNQEPAEHYGVQTCAQVEKALRAGETLHVRHERIIDLLAHTRQTLRVDYDEWESLVKIFPDDGSQISG